MSACRLAKVSIENLTKPNIRDLTKPNIGTARVEIGNALRLQKASATPTTIRAIKAALTMPNPAYASALQHGRMAWGIPSELSFYEESEDTLTIPRGSGPELARLLGAGVDWSDKRRVLPEIDLTFSGKLRDYQQEAVAAVMQRNQGVLEASTGAGKTVMALAIIAARRQPCLILVHGQELMRQWRERIQQFLGIEAGQIGAGKCDVRPVTVGVINSVRGARLDELVQRFGHVCVDECHRAPSSMFTEAVRAFDSRYLLGLSATPYRRDGLTKVIGFYIGPVLHKVDPARLRDIGAVLRPEIVARETAFDFTGNASEDYQAMLTALVEDPGRNELIADDVADEIVRGSGTALVVSDRVAHLEALSACLLRRGIEMDMLTGKTPRTQRRAISERLARGEIQVLGSTGQLIAEGYDAPGLSSLFLTTPVKFSGRVLQVVGRVLRPKADKTPRIYDYQDNRVGVLRASAKARQRVFEGITT